MGPAVIENGLLVAKIEEAQKKLGDTQNQILEAIAERGAAVPSPVAKTDFLGAASVGSNATLGHLPDVVLQSRDHINSPSLRNSGFAVNADVPLATQQQSGFPWEQIGP